MKRLSLIALVVATGIGRAADPPPVVMLLEDGAKDLIPLLTNEGEGDPENSPAREELDDVFSGKSALRVAAYQRHRIDIKGWAYRIAEKPKSGEYRFIRFAWRKMGEGPIMLQLAGRNPADWGHRYHMGGAPPWEAKVLADTAPSQWSVVTRDLFKDFGAFTIAGIAFSPLYGGEAIYDHILLGRTVGDLDRATATAMAKRPCPTIADELRKGLWDGLTDPSEDRPAAITWRMVAGRDKTVEYLKDAVVVPIRKPPKPVAVETMRPLLAAASHHRFVVRESAMQEIAQLGEGALRHVRDAADSAEGEAKARLTAILTQLGARATGEELRYRRAIRVLRLIDTAESNQLAAKLEPFMQ